MMQYNSLVGIKTVHVKVAVTNNKLERLKISYYAKCTSVSVLFQADSLPETPQPQ